MSGTKSSDPCQPLHLRHLLQLLLPVLWGSCSRAQARQDRHLHPRPPPPSCISQAQRLRSRPPQGNRTHLLPLAPLLVQVEHGVTALTAMTRLLRCAVQFVKLASCYFMLTSYDLINPLLSLWCIV